MINHNHHKISASSQHTESNFSWHWTDTVLRHIWFNVLHTDKYWQGKNPEITWNGKPILTEAAKWRRYMYAWRPKRLIKKKAWGQTELINTVNVQRDEWIHSSFHSINTALNKTTTSNLVLTAIFHYRVWGTAVHGSWKTEFQSISATWGCELWLFHFQSGNSLQEANLILIS